MILRSAVGNDAKKAKFAAVFAIIAFLDFLVCHTRDLYIGYPYF